MPQLADGWRLATPKRRSERTAASRWNTGAMGVADSDESAANLRSSRPAQSPSKKKSGTGRKGNNVGPRAPQLKEPWRKDSKARQLLAEPARAALTNYLDEDVSVVPQAGAPSLPTLSITPAEIIRHILSRMTSFAGASTFAEIYGGVAQSIVAVNNGLHSAGEPTDFDVRFYIPRTYNDARDFDRCRGIVEEFLIMKLQLALDSTNVEVCQKLPTLVRTRYFQKQVVIGGALSLLSCGDPASGKGVDLEFSFNRAGDRKYFDDANSFVIPLSLQHLAGLEPVNALSMARNFEHALSLASNGELFVGQPAQVVNGLSLYAHALSDKGLTPSDAGDEEAYGVSMVESFKHMCFELQEQGKDPLRFVKSFIRSHYPGRPVACLAMVAQIVAEFAAFIDTQEGASGDGDSIQEAVAFLLSAQVLAAVDSQGPEPESEALYSLLTIVCFVRSPGNVAPAPAGERSVRVVCEHGRVARLLRKPKSCARAAGRLCQRTAEALRERESGADRWREGLLDCICSMLESKGLAEEEACDAPRVAAAEGPADVQVHGAATDYEILSKPPAPISKPKSYAAAALAAHVSVGKGPAGQDAATKPGESSLPAAPVSADHVPVQPTLKWPDQTLGLSVRPLPRIRSACDAVADVLRRLEFQDAATGLMRSKVVGTSAQQGRPGVPGVAAAHEPKASSEATADEDHEAGPVCDTPRAGEAACGAAEHADWPSPTRSTDHAWSSPHASELSSLNLEQARWKRLGEVTGGASGRVAVTVDLPDKAGGSGCSVQCPLPSSPFSDVPRARSIAQPLCSPSSSASSSPLFTYRGLFESSAFSRPMVQLDEPLFRLAPADRYDSDMDASLDAGSSAADGTNTPTSSASSSSSFASSASSSATSAASDLALETLVRTLLGQDCQATRSAPPSTGKDYSLSKDYRWELADRWATSGLEAFPAPWSPY